MSSTAPPQTYASPPPSFSAAPSPPAASPVPSRPPDSILDGSDLEEPPPYTANPAVYRGETTIEQGPARPFQPAPRPPSQNQQRWPHLSPQATGSSSFSASAVSRNRSAGSLLHQLTNSLTNSVNAAINNMNSPPPQAQQLWSSYPGRQPQQTQQQPPSQSYRPPGGPPPLHPSSSMSRRSSEFARDFYAAGAIDEPRDANAVYMPPPGSPPPSLPRRPSNITTASASTSSAAPATPNDGRPTNHSSIGHPLLKDGKLLVYPKGFECPKCHNIGYKDADPLRPCKKCWSKYARPFTGPLVYSFSPPSSSSPTSSTSPAPSSTPAQNFQRALPHPPPPKPPPIPPALSLSAPPAHFAAGGYMTDHHGGFYTPPTGVHPAQTRLGAGIARPQPGAGTAVYMAGDPRIGGRLCWRCDGKGNTSFLLLDRITCPVCGGIGRTF
ncbi:hypothetical protein CVT25_005621 [Psilocybe cyanescens]|uniref:Uncharacterized protein n=1 Tax=Psilocybe cyanescens TaxID=93625 RepID=A0A409X6F9_PSICY|nr:hypothetical protein CVT25_005621 [Psilocybe cyanescens]